MGPNPGGDSLDLSLDNEEHRFLQDMLADEAASRSARASSSATSANDFSFSQGPAQASSIRHASVLPPTHSSSTDVSRPPSRTSFHSHTHPTSSAPSTSDAPSSSSAVHPPKRPPVPRSISASASPQPFPTQQPAATGSSRASLTRSASTRASSPTHHASSSRPMSAVSSSCGMITRPGKQSSNSDDPLGALSIIDTLEQKLASMVQSVGRTDRQTLDIAEQLCKAYNDAAMELVDSTSSGVSSGSRPGSAVSGGRAAAHVPQTKAMQLLEKAQVLAEPGGILSHDPQLRQRLQAVTFNNMGVYYKHKGKAQAALHFLEQARDLEALLPHGAAENPAGTLLNLSAVQSSLGRHTEALASADKALQLLVMAAGLALHEVEAFGLHEDADLGDGRNDGGGSSIADAMRRLGLAEASTLASALYNRAVQMEFLERNQEALRAYAAAAGLATRLLGKGSKLGLLLPKALQNFRLKMRDTAHAALAATGQRDLRPWHRPSSATIYRPANSRPPEGLARPASGRERGRYGGVAGASSTSPRSPASPGSSGQQPGCSGSPALRPWSANAAATSVAHHSGTVASGAYAGVAPDGGSSRAGAAAGARRSSAGGISNGSSSAGRQGGYGGAPSPYLAFPSPYAYSSGGKVRKQQPHQRTQSQKLPQHEQGTASASPPEAPSADLPPHAFPDASLASPASDSPFGDDGIDGSSTGKRSLSSYRPPSPPQQHSIAPGHHQSFSYLVPPSAPPPIHQQFGTSPTARPRSHASPSRPSGSGSSGGLASQYQLQLRLTPPSSSGVSSGIMPLQLQPKQEPFVHVVTLQPQQPKSPTRSSVSSSPARAGSGILDNMMARKEQIMGMKARCSAR